MSEYELEVPAELVRRLEELPSRRTTHPYKKVTVEVLRRFGKVKGWKDLAKVLTEYYNYPVAPETLRKWYAKEVEKNHDPKAL